MQPNDLIAPGDVWLVGAGPGDPDLLTRKAEKLIAAADIVFYDALVGPGVLALIPPGVDQVSVGKRSGRHSKAQQSINDLLLAAARAGKRVVRLKGGDPFIFGRGGEELLEAAAHGFQVEVVPGITAGMAAASYAGIPLTHRHMSQSVRFLTGHRVAQAQNLEWSEWARDDQTLVIYMGLVSLAHIQAHLLAAGRAETTPAVLIENASLPEQREVFAPLGALHQAVVNAGISGPSIIIVGEVVDIPRMSNAKA